ncbi:hypothetical protein KX928_23350 [Roseobacter sp. YSTF-M11]|uniref:Uncharacterized protein n=1 Tax=Roseobacter insulae TaxID=2859783 RepID=A0A9X1FZZ5_9RHOB|nr:hypothetical protein [Roseobacter insulae]MBW4710737.1 hypothetical protein [Roseobacter insulae]
MCEIISTALAASGFAGGAAATGAAAGAATAGGLLQTAGLLLSVGGTVAQAVSANKAAKQTAAEIEVQRALEKRINATEDQRARLQFASQIATQRAELAARGVSPDSPTAILLGQTAARELSFQSQSIRSTGEATDRELSATARATRARGRRNLLTGSASAAGKFLTAAPEIWPDLLP